MTQIDVSPSGRLSGTPFVVAAAPEGSSDIEIACCGLDERELRLPRALYCAAKPVVALAACGVLARNERSLASRVGPAGLAADGFELGPLLEHRYPALVHPTLARVHWTAPKDRRTLLADAVTQASSDIGPVSYSEVASWWLLASAVEAEFEGSHWGEALQASLRSELGIDDLWATADDELMTLTPEGIGVSSHLEPDGYLAPLAHEATHRTRSLTSPGFGLFGSAFALRAWYGALALHLDGSAVNPRMFGPQDAANRLTSGAAGRYLVGFQSRWPLTKRPIVGHIAAGGTVGAGLFLDSLTSFAFVGGAYIDSPKRRAGVLREILSTVEGMA